MTSLSIHALGLTVGLLLTACSAGGDPNEADGSTSTEDAATGISTRSSASVHPAPAIGADALDLLQTVTYSTPSIEVTALRFDDPFASRSTRRRHPAPAHTHWAGVLVETCNSPDSISDPDRGNIFTMSVGATDWRLVDADGNRLYRQRTMSDIFPAWPYPVRSTSLVTGLCATGYVMWAVPAGFQPNTVRLVTEGPDGPIAEWTLT